MRIALVHSFYSTAQPSGENRVVEEQAAALRRAGHVVEVIGRHTDNLQGAVGYKVATTFRVATGRGSSPTSELRAFRPDIVHVHNLFPNFGSHWIRSWEGPVVTSIHNFRTVCSNGFLLRNSTPCHECPTSGAWHAVLHGCYRDSRVASIPVALGRHIATEDLLFRPDAVITTSESSDHMLRSLLKRPLNSTVIPNFGAGIPQVPLPPESRRSWLAMGRLSAEKGFHELAEMWPSAYPLTLIGDGPEHDRIATAIAGRPVVMRPAMPIEQLRAELPEYRGLIFPSRWPEAAPQVVVEAMRVGLPVIAHRMNGIAGMVTASGAGATYDDQASLLTALAVTSARLVEASQAAISVFEDQWLEGRWIERVERLYSAISN